MISTLLTISIPTYNRAIYLERCLDSIFNQLKPDSSILVNVYDNCSTDNTAEIVEKFTQKSQLFNYYKNDQNLGPDLNIGQSYYKSNSKYTLVFGDDDVVLGGGLMKILGLLESDNEFGLVFLNYYHFTKDYSKETPKRYNSSKIYSFDDSTIVGIAGMRIGFISACIVNSKAINKDEILEITGSNFNQLSPIIEATKLGYENLYLNEYFIAQQIANFNINNFFKTFTDNFIQVLKHKLGTKDNNYNIILDEFYYKILPNSIYLARKGSESYQFKSDSLMIIDKNFRKDIRYWFTIYPSLKLPLFFVRLIVLFFKIVFKISNRVKILFSFSKARIYSKK